MGLFDMIGNHLQKGQDLKLKLFALLDSGKYGDEDFLKSCLRNYESGYTDSTFKNIEMDMNYKYNLEDEISGNSEKMVGSRNKRIFQTKRNGKII